MNNYFSFNIDGTLNWIDPNIVTRVEPIPIDSGFDIDAPRNKHVEKKKYIYDSKSIIDTIINVWKDAGKEIKESYIDSIIEQINPDYRNEFIKLCHEWNEERRTIEHITKKISHITKEEEFSESVRELIDAIYAPGEISKKTLKQKTKKTEILKKELSKLKREKRQPYIDILTQKITEIEQQIRESYHQFCIMKRQQNNAIEYSLFFDGETINKHYFIDRHNLIRLYWELIGSIHSLLKHKTITKTSNKECLDKNVYFQTAMVYIDSHPEIFMRINEEFLKAIVYRIRCYNFICNHQDYIYNNCKEEKPIGGINSLQNIVQIYYQGLKEYSPEDIQRINPFFYVSEQDKLMDRYKENKNFEQLAFETGTSTSIVIQHLKKYGMIEYNRKEKKYVPKI